MSLRLDSQVVTAPALTVRLFSGDFYDCDGLF
jgi:hypothetical protein